MKYLASTAVLLFLAGASAADILAKGKQPPAAQPDLCVVPPGAQPLLPAKLLPGMGATPAKDFPVTTSSEDARKFFLQGV